MTTPKDRKQISKVVAACLFGDAHITKDARVKQGNSSFELGQTEEHKDHIDYIANYVSEVTSVRYDVRPHITHKTTIRIRTKVHPFFTNFRERMYPIGRKVIDPHYLTLLDYEFLAIWFMQDGWHSGSWTSKQTLRHEVALASESFCYAENMLLRSALKEKLNLDWNVKRHRSKSGSHMYRLHLATKDIDTMLQGIAPYIQPSFTYKIDKTVVYNRLAARRELKEHTQENLQERVVAC